MRIDNHGEGSELRIQDATVPVVDLDIRPPDPRDTGPPGGLTREVGSNLSVVESLGVPEVPEPLNPSPDHVVESSWTLALAHRDRHDERRQGEKDDPPSLDPIPTDKLRLVVIVRHAP